MRRLASLPLLLSLACGGERSHSEDAVATWTVNPTPLLTLGRDEGEDAVLLERITGATRLGDGRILVADLGAAPLKLFSADGAYAGAIAREGSGPGEYRYLARLYACGDTLFAYDIDGYRTSVLNREAAYVRSFRFTMPEGQQTPYVSACATNQRFAHLGWGMLSRPVAGVHRDTVPMWTTTSAEGQPVVIDSVPGSERWGMTYQGRIVGSRPLPFGRQPHIGTGTDRLYLATGDDFTVRVYDHAGRPLPALTAALPPAPVTPEDIRALIEREVLKDGEQRRRAVERELGEIQYPAAHAAVTALVVDALDQVWLRPYAGPGAAVATWRVFAPTGELLALVDLPQALEVLEIGSDYILGRSIDEESLVPVLHMHRLQRDARRQ